VRKLGSRYVLHDLLGQGTTGEVWRGTTTDSGRQVAIKVLRPELADDPAVVDRFLREWTLLRELDSPDLVRVLDLVNEPTALAIVMELVNGVDLRTHLQRHSPFPLEEAVRIVVDVLWALDTVHAAGIVHRDVKPENVLIDTTDPSRPIVRLTDFGIARMVTIPSQANVTAPIGTPMYMAPESGSGAPPTASADIYAAGVVFYELLAGVPPFDEPDPTEMLHAHRERPPLRIQGVPPAVWEILAAMLAKTPHQRPPSAARAADDLIDALERDRKRERDRDWDAEQTQLELVTGDRGRGWDLEDTQVAAATGGHRWGGHTTGTQWVAPGRSRPAGPNDRDTAATGTQRAIERSQPTMRVPGRAGPTAADTNTLISAIEATRRPAPGAGDGSGRPPGPDRRRRARIGAAAGLVVALVAGAGGWALAANSGEEAAGGSGPARLAVGADPTASLPNGDAGVLPTGPGSSPDAAGAHGQPGASGVPKPGQSAGQPGPTAPGGSSPAPAPTTASPTPTDATVPSVVNLSRSDATSRLSQAGFTNVTSDDTCTKGETGNVVQAQTPTAGSKVAKTTKVTLTVQATDCRNVPDVTGRTVQDAKDAITAVGLTPIDTTETCSYRTGAVASQDPAAGNLIRSGNWVYFKATCIASPPPPPPPTR
jgi:Protein kinase domain/PASTA domain